MTKVAKIFNLLAIVLIPLYFLRFSVHGLPTNILEIAILAAFLITLCSLLVTKSKVAFGSIFIYLFLLAAFVSIFFAADKTTALGIFKGWFVVPVVLYWVTINNFNTKNIKYILGSLIIPLQLVSLWAIAQKVGLITTLFYQTHDLSFEQYLSTGRYFGPFESPNFLAMFIVPLIFLTLALWPHLRKRYKGLLLISYLIPLYALYLAGSHGGDIALVAGIFAGFTLYFWRRKKYSKALLALGIGIVVGVLLFSQVNITSDSNKIRQQIYSYSFQMIRANPVKGIGLGSYHTVIGRLSANDLYFQTFGIDYALHPHNIFLAMWLNLGIFGFLLFLALLLLFKLQILKSRGAVSYALLAAMAAILIHGLFDTTYFKNDLSAIFWLIMALSFIQSKNADSAKHLQ